METKNADLSDLKKKAGVRNLGKMTAKQFGRVQKLAAEGELTLEQLKLLVRALPHFVVLQKQTIEGLKKVAEGARESQREAIRAVSHALDAASRTLEILAGQAETDETRLKLAEQAVEVGRLGIEVGTIIAQMNRDNNSFWRTIAATAGFVTVVLIIVFSGGRMRSLTS